MFVWIFVLEKMLKTRPRKQAFFRTGIWAFFVGLVSAFTIWMLLSGFVEESIISSISVIMGFSILAQFMHAFNLRKVLNP